MYLEFTGLLTLVKLQIVHVTYAYVSQLQMQLFNRNYDCVVTYEGVDCFELDIDSM